jgi:nicotinate phosphoribosyltransferase
MMDREASGTMPHALMLATGKGEQERAWTAFNEGVPDNVPRIVLCDTFTDEKDETLRAVKELGDDISGIRIDTTGSRRGDFEHIIKEVKWALHEEGRDDVDIFISGGLGPGDIEELKHLVEGFGVGSYISNADPVDFSLDIVQREGEPISKRGKNSGVKRVARVMSDSTIEHRVLPDKQIGEPGPIYDLESEPVDIDAVVRYPMEKLVDDGEVLTEYTIEEAEKNRREDVEELIDGDKDT